MSLRKIEGLLLSAKIHNPDYKIPQEYLYGPQTSPGVVYPFERFSTNGLVPFETINDAYRHRYRLEQRRDLYGLAKVRVIDLSLTIAEDDESINDLNPRLAYVLLHEDNQFSETYTHLYGSFNEESPRIGAIPVSYLEDNGFVGWNSVKALEHAREELARQGRMGTKVANFKMRRVSRKV